MMNFRSVKCGFIAGGALFLGMLVFGSAHLVAGEQAAPLAFEKGKISNKDTYFYTLKQQDTLYSLVSSIYEPESGRTRKQIYDAIQQLNPELTSIHVTFTGQKLRLPKKHLFPGGRTVITTDMTTAPEKVEVALPDPPPPTSDYRMAVIRDVITRMDGTLSTAGNYYIPLPQSGQISIDCTRIPVAELADGSIILLVFPQRMSAPPKKIIPEHLPNYHSVVVSLNEESPIIIQKVLMASKAYSMRKIRKPLDVGKAPQLQIAPGWLITEKDADGGERAIQLITFLKDRQRLLPKAFIDEARRSNLTITEVIEGRGVVHPPATLHEALPIPDLRGSTPMDLVVSLLNILNLQPTDPMDDIIVAPGRDGLHLSVKADLIIRQGNKRTMFHATPLPLHFLDILRENNVEPVLLTQDDSRRTIIEKTLAGLGVSFSSDIFSFSVPKEADKPRGVIRVPAIHVTFNKSSCYLIEFDIDQDLHRLLHQQWGVNLIKY